MDTPDEPGWAPRRTAALAAMASGHRVGPHQLGQQLRAGRYGPVWLAVHPEAEEVRELEHYEALAPRVADDSEGLIMQDVAHLAGVEHRHVAKVIAAGWHDDAPYVVRPFVLGVGLDEVLARGPLPEDVAVGVVFSAAEALAHLSDAGARPGACAHGGLGDEDLRCGYDGRVRMVGLGLRRIYGEAEAAVEADRVAVIAMAARFGLEVPDAALEEVARHLRRTHREAAGRRHERLGRYLRRCFADRIADERSQAGLSPMQ